MGLEGIAGSDLTVAPNPPHTLNPVYTDDKLPNSNDEFGDKQLTVSGPGGTPSGTTTVKIFFGRNGTDHPEIQAGELPNWLRNTAEGSASIPNWYYYWKQTSANFGEHVLADGSLTPAPWDPNGLKTTIGRDCWSSKNNTWPLIGPPAESNQFAPLVVSVSGIDKYAWTCRHEAMHKTVWNELYPDGQPRVDTDEDGLPDEFERQTNVGYTVGGPGGASTNGGLEDIEDYVLWRQQTETPWVPESAKSEDWSSPGQQSAE